MAAWDISKVEILCSVVGLSAAYCVASGYQLRIIELLSLTETVELQLLLECLLLTLGT